MTATAPTASLSLSSGRAVFWFGEHFSVDLEVTNLGAATIVVPAPYDPAHGLIRYDVVPADGSPGFDLAARGRRSAEPLRDPIGEVELRPGRTHRAAVPLGAWARLPPGAYTVRARWSTAGGEVVSEPLSLVIERAWAMHLALPAQVFEALPAGLSASALVLGAGLAHAFERRFGEHLENEGEFVHAFDVEDLAPERPPVGLVRVAAAAVEPQGWRAWVDAAALCAKAGVEVGGAAALALPVGGRVEVVGPAFETRGHALVAVVLHSDGGETRVLSYRFDPPVTVVDPADPDDPDDWDDEDLAVGPARVDLLGVVPQTMAGASALAVDAATGEARLLCAFDAEAGLTLVHLAVSGGRASVTATAAMAGAHAVPGAAPALFIDERGDSVAAVVALRQRPDVEGLDLLLVTVRIAGAEVRPTVVEWPACLAAPPRAATVAFSSLAGERPFARAVVLRDDGGVLAADTDARAVLLPVVGIPLAPVSLLVTRSSLHLGVAAYEGPLLEVHRSPAAPARAET